MLILLPPSETKRDGGAEGSRLDYTALRFPKLGTARRAVVRSLRALARDKQASIAALKLGKTQHHEVAKNKVFTTSPTMPAVDRYTGVLYDALDAASLDETARDFLARSVAVHSAVLGPVGALDPIPDYRLSHDSRLPGLSLVSHWAPQVSKALAKEPGLILDARSEVYAALGPAPRRDDTVFLRVVSEGEDGRRRALNHFNKQAKGLFVRALAAGGAEPETVPELLDWAVRSGFVLESGEPQGPSGLQELILVV